MRKTSVVENLSPGTSSPSADGTRGWAGADAVAVPAFQVMTDHAGVVQSWTTPTGRRDGHRFTSFTQGWPGPNHSPSPTELPLAGATGGPGPRSERADPTTAPRSPCHPVRAARNRPIPIGAAPTRERGHRQGDPRITSGPEPAPVLT